MKKGLFGIAALILILVSSCEFTPIKRRGSGRTLKAEYLDFWLNKQILPSYQEYEKSCKNLMKAADTLLASGDYSVDSKEVNDVKRAYENSFLSLQDILIFGKKIFNNLPIYEVAATTRPNISVIDETSIENLEYGIDHNLIGLRAVGYSAMDYILYGGKPLNDRRVQYLAIICRHQYSYAKKALDDIQTNIDKFLSDDGFSPTGTLSQILNNLISNYEQYIRNIKLSIPMGKSGPDLKDRFEQRSIESVEAYYHGGDFSTKLTARALKRMQDFYLGNSFFTNETSVNGLRNLFLSYIKKDTKKVLIANLDGNISTAYKYFNRQSIGLQQIINNKTDYSELNMQYSQIQSVVGVLKSKVLIDLGLTVTFADGEEGD